MPSCVTGKRSRRIALFAAGTLAVAGAVSAAAVTLPTGPAVTSAGPAFVRLANVTREQNVTGQERFSLGAVEGSYTLAAAQAAKAATQARQEAAKQSAQAAAQQVTQQAAVAVATGSPQQIADGMLGQFGWSSSQFSCLDPLWTQESGWNVSASNPGSGAYGIPQALPGSKMASAGADWETDAVTQIRWGLEYIQSTYGSPCGAWAHEEADGWY
jgi:hypothetical protein